MKIIIPGELPDLNQIIDAAKLHYAKYAKMKKENTETVAWLAKGIKIDKQIDLVVTWYCKDKRKDKDNIAAGIKFILDGIVAAGVIKNDGWKEVGSFEHRFMVDKEYPRIEVEIITDEEDKQFDWGD